MTRKRFCKGTKFNCPLGYRDDSKSAMVKIGVNDMLRNIMADMELPWKSPLVTV